MLVLTRVAWFNSIRHGYPPDFIHTFIPFLPPIKENRVFKKRRLHFIQSDSIIGTSNMTKKNIVLKFHIGTNRCGERTHIQPLDPFEISKRAISVYLFLLCSIYTRKLMMVVIKMMNNPLISIKSPQKVLQYSSFNNFNLILSMDFPRFFILFLKLANGIMQLQRITMRPSKMRRIVIKNSSWKFLRGA